MDSKTNNVYLCERQSGLLVRTAADIFSRLLSFSQSLMCFPCVLERQTQLHFNDTQMLLGFRMWRLCPRVHARVFVLFHHFSVKPAIAPPTSPMLVLVSLHVTATVSTFCEGQVVRIQGETDLILRLFIWNSVWIVQYMFACMGPKGHQLLSSLALYYTVI